MKVTIKCSNENRLSIDVEATEKVIDLKKKIESRLSDPTPPESQRLIFSGRIMKDDDELSVYKIEESHT